MIPRLAGQGTAWLDWMILSYLLLGLTSGFVWIFRVKAATDKQWNESRQLDLHRKR
jgi:hypothetical protein